MPRVKYILIALFLVLLYPVVAQCQVAGFTVDNTSGCVPLVVHFTNTSTGATSYSWNFGNSTSSALSDPSVGYGAPGAYTVTLTAYNGASSSTSSMVITVYPLPTVAFTANDTTVCPGTPVIYTNGSVGGTPGTTSYTWNFGDGSTSSITSPVYTHGAPGYYNITLFATNSMGCYRSLTKPSYLQVYTSPVAGFSGSGTYICKPPSSVAFSNSSSGTMPLLYNWSFGDGSGASSAPLPSHSYTAAGSYTVRLRVTDGNGCIDSMVNPGYVYVSSLTAAFPTPANVCQFISPAFSNTSSPHISSNWDFGDGFSSIDELPSHPYALPGIYTTRLIVSDGSCYDTVSHPVTIYANPTGTFTISPANPCPAPVTMNYSASVSAGSTATWQLMYESMFSVGSLFASGLSVNKTYAFGIMDTVFMTVTNSNGCSIVVSKMDTVYNLILDITATKPLGCIPLTTSFLCSVSASAYNPITQQDAPLPVPYAISTYTWNFGDGSPTVVGPSPSHTYTAVGSYNVSCTILTSSGCTKTKGMTIKTGVPPTITFTATPTHLCAGQKVHFVSAVTGTVTDYFWKYGDGAFDSGGVGYNNIIHKYETPGLDTARVKAYHNGCPSLEAKTPILVDSPGAVPSYNFLCIPNNGIQFGDGSVGATSRLWLFGDGFSSSAATPIHYFPSLTAYNVMLTTYNSTTGCRDTAIASVDLTPPFLYLYSLDPTICLHESVNLYSFISGGSALRYKWYVDGGLVMDSTLGTISTPINTPGLHDITMIIQDDRGCFDTFTRSQYVLTGNPVDSFTASPSVGCGPLAVNFIDHSSGIPACRLMSYTWDFGMGAPPTTLATPGASNTYPAGTYSVVLTVTDSIGCTSTTSPPIQVTVYRPHAAFYADANNVCMGTNVHFNNISSSAGSYLWMFGDGTTSTVVAPYHTYTASGVYTVQLKATDTHGCSDTATLLNYIYVAPSPHAGFTMSDSFAVCPPLNVNFTNTSTGAVSYSWNFGNSTTSIAYSPSSPYIAPGYYTVRLVASNSIGCTDTARRHVNVFGYSGAFSYTPVSGCMPLAVHFSASLGTVASLVWDFGDGATSGGGLSDTISHTYITQGLYVPKLILTDTTGCLSYSVGADTIKVDVLTPNFRITPNPVCQASPVTFTDSSYAVFGPATSWAWSFGSGATGTGYSPVYTYSLAGTHSVTLAVTNSNGCTATVTKTVTVNALPDTIAGVRAVCVGYTTLLTNASPGGTWSTSAPGIAAVSSSGLVSGMGVGTARITYTLSAGCISTAVVTVYAVPSSISGSNSICEGNNTIYSCITTGGTWSSGSPSVATVNSVTGSVTGILAGTATITYSLGSGCNTTKVISVNATPTPLTGIASVCKGLTTTLFETLAGGTWTSSTASVGTVDASGNITGIGAGTTGITYTMSTGCFAGRIVTVNPLPDTITGTLAVCYGSTTVLADATAGGTWTSGNPAVAFIHPVSGTVLGMTVGTAIITYSLNTGCIATKVVSVNGVPAAISGTATVCKNGITVLYESLPGGAWISGTPSVATIDAGGTVTGVAPGTSVITYSYGTGCMVSTVVTVNPLPDTISGNPALCFGFTTLLHNATPGGTWTSTNITVAPISSTGSVNAVALGTSIISYTLPTGCASGVVATVNPLPDPITGATNICVGIPTVLSSTTPGGTWSSGNLSVATIDLYSGVYTGVSAGTADITYTSVAGCITTTTITMQALPPVIGGGPTVCNGFAVNLTNAMPGGTWSSDPAASMIGTVHHFTGVVTGITPGTVTITYTIMTGCMRNLVVTVLPLPSVIAGAPRVCVTETVTLSNATAGGTWSSSNTARATIDPVTGVVTGISPGTAVITYLISTGCFNILHITVNPLPAPIVGPGNVCEGASVALSDPTPSGVWISAHTDTAIVGFSSGIVTGVRAGTTLVSYSLPTGCKVTKLMTVLQTPPAITGNPHVCTGASVTLANAMPGGSWASSNIPVATVGSSTGVVTPVSLGIAFISYIMPVTGCFATRLVTVEPLPVVYSVTGGGNYCAGASGVHVGLSGSQPGVSYVLYYGSSVSGYLAGSGFSLDFGSLTPAGIYTVHATNVISGCERNMAGSATINIIPLVTPAVAINATPDDTSCPGNTVTLSPIPVYGGSSPVYLWKVNGSIVGSAGSYAFVPANGDVVTATMTSNANCLITATVTGSLTMTVLPSEKPVVNIAVSPDDTICEFGLATYTALPVYGGYTPSYKWMVNSLPVGTGAVYSYVPQHGDAVTCTMLSNYLCRLQDTAMSGAITMSIDSLAPPVVTIAADPGLYVLQGTPVTLSTSVTNGGPHPGYQWRINGKPVAGATNSSFTSVFNDKDSIVCEVTSNGVCEGIRAFDWVFIATQPLGIQQAPHTTADITLVPNPNKGNFTIRGRVEASSGDMAVTVADMLGQVVYKGVITVKGGYVDQDISLDSKLANGMYLLTLDLGYENKTFHFVIKQ